MAVTVKPGTTVRVAYSPDQPRDDHGRFGSKGGDDKIAHVNAIMEHIDERIDGHTGPNDEGNNWGRTDTSEEMLRGWSSDEVAALDAAGYHGDDVAAAIQEWGWGGTGVLRDPNDAEQFNDRDGGGPDFDRGSTEALDFIAHNEISAPLERGWAMRAEMASDLKPGDALRAGPSSWTTDPEVADVFSTYRMNFSDGRVPVTIHNDGPVHGIYAAALVPSDYAWQHEVIVNEPALTVTRIERHDGGGADVWVKASSAKAAAAVSPDVLGEELFGETFGQVSARVEGRKVKRAYAPDQPRDEHGRFGEGSGDVRATVARLLAEAPDGKEYDRKRLSELYKDSDLADAIGKWVGDAHYISRAADSVLTSGKTLAQSNDDKRYIEEHHSVDDAKVLLDGVAKAPATDEALFRGLRVRPDLAEDARAEFALGKTVDVPLASFSSDLGEAQKWANGNYGVYQTADSYPILIRAEPGAQALHIAPISQWPDEDEWVASGRFAVTDSKPYTDYSGHQGTQVTLRYEGALKPVKAAAAFTYSRPPQWLLDELCTSLAAQHTTTKVHVSSGLVHIAYTEGQMRDEHGRWTSNGVSGADVEAQARANSAKIEGLFNGIVSDDTVARGELKAKIAQDLADRMRDNVPKEWLNSPASQGVPTLGRVSTELVPFPARSGRDLDSNTTREDVGLALDLRYQRMAEITHGGSSLDTVAWRELRDRPDADGHTMMQSLGDKLDLDPVRGYAAALVDQWHMSAGDSMAIPIAMQKLEAERFGGDTRYIDANLHGESTLTGDLHGQVAAVTDGLRPVASAFMDAEHEATQERLTGVGIKPDDPVLLYRGMGIEEVPITGAGVERGRADVNPMSSWSTDWETARNFGYGDMVASTVVPASDIFATAVTGRGAPFEHEVILHSSDGEVAIDDARSGPQRAAATQSKSYGWIDKPPYDDWIKSVTAAREAKRAYSPDQPRDDHGRFGEGSSTIKDWAKGHPRGTLYRAMSKTDLARVRSSGMLTGSRSGEVWVSNVAKDEYLSKDEVLVAIKPERGDVTGAGAPGDLKLREVPAGRIIDVYDPLTAERRARTNAAMQGAAFNEEDHPRDEHGRFTSEGGRSALDKKFTERTVGSSSLRGPSYKAKAEGARAIAEHGEIPAAVMGKSMDAVFVTPPGSTSRLDATLNLLKTNGGGDFARTPGIPNDFAIKSDGATVEQFGELNDLSHQLITMNEMFTDDQEPNADKSAIGRAIGALQSPASVEDVLTAARSADPKLDLNGERGIAAMYIDQWAHTSGDHDPIAIATQITAGRVFGASTADIEHHFASSGGHMEDLQPTIDAERPVTEAVLGGMHNATQAYLGSLGFAADDKIAMFRGVTSKGPIPDLPSLDHLGTNPMSAWTTDAHQAEIFASNDVYGYVARSEVNVRDVIATPFTGMGALYQHEAVLIGDGATRPVTIEPATSAAKIEAPVRAAASTFGLLWIDEPPNDDWLKTLARAKGKTVTRIDINGPVNVNIKPRQGYSPDQPRDDHGRFGLGGTGSSTVDKLLAENPKLPGEAAFEWQSRVVSGLDPQTQSDVLYATRELYKPVDYIRAGADKWCDAHGLPRPPANLYAKPVDIKEADAVARYFERTPDQSADPRVQAAYADFKSQNEEMYSYMTKPESEGGLGIKVDFTSVHDPYKDAETQAEDLRNNHHISIESGLGGAHDFTMTTEEYDRFRAVHDVFGHAGVGGGFDRHGEYEAWLMHSSMYTGAGRAAMSTEYHAVNSALWSGEKGTPGTGKSILLPDQYASPPWDRQAAALVAKGPDYSVKELVRKLGLDSTFAQQFDDCPMHPHAHAPRRAYSPDQPRDDHGRWGTGGGAGGDIAEGIASGGHKGTPDDPIRVGKNLDLAARLIAQGKSVRLDQPDQVATLLGKLNAIANDAKEKGVKAPNYNLCNVSVEGSNLFCHDSKGIPRVEMPQFKGMAVPGSPAASMTPNAKGEVNIGDAFLQHVQDQGIAVKETSIDSSHLRASQNELVGTQVAGMVQAAQDGKLDLASERIYTTRDNYIIDGHHRWAADVGLSYVKGQPMQTPVYQLDMDIGQALDMANEFATQQGIAPKKGAALAAALSAVSQILDGKVTHVRIVPPFS